MRKALGRSLICLSVVVIGYFLAAFVGALVPGPGTRPHDQDTVEIRLLKGPIHYDFLIPLTPIARRELDGLRHAGLPVHHPHTEWVMIGWGARAFYTTTGSYSDVSFGAIARGLTGDRSVIRVDLIAKLNPQLQLPSVHLSLDQFERFLRAITASFEQTDQGQWIPLNVSGFSETDRFFAANGRFNALRTCNVWIGETLRAAGVRFGIWVPLPYSVTLSRRLYQSDVR